MEPPTIPTPSHEIEIASAKKYLRIVAGRFFAFGPPIGIVTEKMKLNAFMLILEAYAS
jgi:hypothetical protein